MNYSKGFFFFFLKITFQNLREGNKINSSMLSLIIHGILFKHYLRLKDKQLRQIKKKTNENSISLGHVIVGYFATTSIIIINEY